MSADLIDSVIDEAARFNRSVLSPLSRSGDEEGRHFDNRERRGSSLAKPRDPSQDDSAF